MNDVAKLFSFDEMMTMLAGFLPKLIAGLFVVAVADQYGSVMEITMRSTRTRTRQNTFVVIPNKSIIDHVLVSHTKHGATRVDVPVGIAY